MKEINEGCTCVVELKFKDENGLDVIPTSGRYNVVDAESGTITQHWTAFAPASATYLAVIPANHNRLIAQEHVRETRVVTVEFTYGAGSYIGTGEVKYTLLGLKNY